jgi:RND superfamily putative drug exporter
LATFLYRVGHLAVRHRRSVVAAWVALLLLAAGASGIAGGATSDDISLPGTESQQAFDLLEERFPEEGGSFTQVVFAAGAGGSLADPAAAAAIDATMAVMGEVEGVSAALPPSATGALSTDATVALGVVRYPVSAYEVGDETTEAVAEAARQATDAGVTVEFGGPVVPGVELEPPSSELLGLGVAVLVLLLSFGSVLAMGLPIATALLGLGIGMSGIGLASAFVDLSSTAPTLAVMIGLAVGIDYALFVVTRHRQNLAVGLDVEEAAARANATAGGAVVFAGVTVVIAIAGLAVIGIPFVTVMGLAAAATVAIAVLVAITLLPALLGFAGHNIDRLRVPGVQNRTGGMHEGETLGTRWARAVTRRPVLALIGGLAVMGVLAIPVASMRLGLPDAGSEPADTTQRRAYDLVSETFGPGFNGQLTVIVDLTGVADRDAALADVAAVLGAHDSVAVVAPASVNATGDTAVVQVIRAGRGRDRAPRPRAARRHSVPSGARHRRAVLHRRVDGRQHRHLRQAGRRPRAVHGAGHRPDRRAAHRRVPVDPRAGEGGAGDPGVDRVVVRRHRRRVQLGLVGRADRGRADHPHRQLPAGDDVRHPVRTLDGLRGVHPQPHPRGVPPHRRRPGQRAHRDQLVGAGDHRRGAHHDQRLRRLRPG